MVLDAITPDAEAGPDGPTDAPAADVELPGLVAHYPFDEDAGAVARDTLGNNGSVVGNAVWTAGKIGGALSFDGKTHVEIQSVDALTPTASFTVAMWTNYDPARNAVPGEDPRLYAHRDSFDLKLNGTHLQLTALLVGGTVKVAEVASTEISAPWHHVAVTFDRGDVRWYFDGVSLDIVSSPAAFDAGDVVSPNKAMTYIGSYSDGSSAMVGLLDDLRVYNRALSVDEIRHFANP